MLERIETVGRKVKQARPHNKVHDIIIDDNLGRPAFVEDGVMHEAVPPYFDLPKFQRQNRMGPKLFVRLLDEIADLDTRHGEVMKGLDSVGENNACALWKLTIVMRQLAYGVAFDVVEEYIWVAKGGERKSMYAL